MIKTLKKFDTISLSEMDSRMGSIGLERMEKKYIIHASKLDTILKELHDDYAALEIKGLREFQYDNMYFDTKEYKLFHDHGKGYKLRTKLRTRHYVDSNIAFFEFKQRYYETIRKFKFNIKVSKHGTFTQKMKTFSNKLFESIYQHKLNETIIPSMKTSYVRFTLCSKKNDERITFDTKVTFQDPRSKKSRPYILSDIILVESKSGKTSHHTQEVLSKHNIKTMNGISKYCLGVLLQGVVTTKYKKFETLLTYIHALQVKH
ncbi:MAG TPA: polyphosphate polymerase domain-containing protein [Candidatus Absconditabacterales bacterium]|nr:polyphosphate polymerase domain-containing protein [Candidatus Absconditabacterales bacterium]HNG97180.1 polyphosphate polymerase domain-containing protein [Candidatus Absconditabacterales bacterium]